MTLTSPPFFRVTSTNGLARTGQFNINRQEMDLQVETPILFPVANLITGTTPNAGGIWKYIRKWLFKTHTPFISQALQFLDFRLTGSEVGRWLSSHNGTVMDRYLDYYRSQHPELGINSYRGIVFADSGGYKFLTNPNMNLTAYGIANGGRAWKGVLQIQQSLGGDIYTSLDYPLRPGLIDTEARQAIIQTLRNAIKTYRALQQQTACPPFFVPCHGRNQEEMRQSVSAFFQYVQTEGRLNGRLGVAIGSLVPLRTVQRVALILSIVQGAQAGVPTPLRDQIPLHVFGISGNMLPLLAYLGIDSFDSSSYLQNARTLDYFVPSRRTKTRLLEMEGEELPCTCPHCHGQSLSDWQQVLITGNQQDLTKSEVYARLALHNLYWDQVLLDQTREAIKQKSVEEFLVEHASHYASIRPGVEWLARSNTALMAKLSRHVFGPISPWSTGHSPLFGDGPIDLDLYEPGLPPWKRSACQPLPILHPFKPSRQFSQKYSPDAFVVSSRWQPNPQKDIVLFLPCSDHKPYRDSHSHRAILRHLSERLGSVSRIQKVTISGLYGPVPEELEDEHPVLGYDFRLLPHDETQIQLCASRLVSFLERYGDCFFACLGYATSRAYREVMQRAVPLFPRLMVFPLKPIRQQMTELFRKENLDQLTLQIEREVHNCDVNRARQASS